MKIPTKSISKFNEDKTYKYFPGSSIVKMLDDKKTLDNIYSIVDDMKKSNLFEKFVFLPTNSYHMTVCDLVTYLDILENENYLNLVIDKNQKYEMIDSDILNKLKDYDFNLNVEMKVVEINYKQILLSPNTENDSKTIRQFREYIYNTLGIKIKDNYNFHISLTYKLFELNETEKNDIKKFLEKLNAKYLNKFDKIRIDKPTLVAFNDMSDFRKICKGREGLGNF